MAIRQLVSGFGVYDSYGRLRAKVASFDEAIAENEKLEVTDTEPESVERVEMQSEGITRIVYPPKVKISQRKSRGAICSKNPWRSKSIGVNPAQAESFSNAAREAGISGAEYDGSTGELVCTSNSARNAEMARRGFGDADAGYGQRAPGG